MSEKYLYINEVVDSISKTHKFDKPQLIFLNTSDVEAGKIISNQYFSISELKGQAKKTIQNEDILFSEIRPKNRRFALVNVENPEDYVVSTKLMVLRNKNKSVDNRYFYYYLTNEHMLSILQDRAENRIGSFPQITFDLLSEYKIRVPLLPTQQRIANILKVLDDKIELNNKINAELEAMAKTLYDYWFVQFDFPDVNSKLYRSSGGKMVYNEKLKREIPEGWEVNFLDSYISKIIDYRGRTPKKLGKDWSNNPDDIIALSAKHVKNGKLVNLHEANKVDAELYDIWMAERLEEGDILMTSEAPCGEFFYLIGKKDFCLSQRLFAIRANDEKLKSSYLYFELSKGNGLSQILGKQSGSTVFGIRQDELRKVYVLKPPLFLQSKFDKIIIDVYNRIRNNDFQNQQLASLRDWLLPMLMNGQVGFKDEIQPPQKASDKQAKCFQKIQSLYSIIYANNEIGIQQGEMAIAKDLYLVDRIGGVNTGFNFAQHNWGSFDPTEKQIINNKQYFIKKNYPNSKAIYYDLKDGRELLSKISMELKAPIKQTIQTLHQKVFRNFQRTAKAEEKELYATVLKCIEDTQSIELSPIREEMKRWKTPKQQFPDKATKFSEERTRVALNTIVSEGWHKNVMK